jgi:hypothetical protein
VIRFEMRCDGERITGGHGERMTGRDLAFGLLGGIRFTYLDLGGEVLHECADDLGFVVGEVGGVDILHFALDRGMDGGLVDDFFLCVR